MSKRDPVVPLQHMRDHARKAVRILGDMDRSDLEEDEVVLLALTRLLEVLGEAARRVPDEVRERYEDIPWRSVVGLRNVLIHGYDTVDLDILWRILSEDLPALLPRLDDAVQAERR